jgi:hypothetical protein
MSAQATRPKAIFSDALWRPLIDAGVISEDQTVRRVVIDIQASEPVVVYVEQYGDERLLQVAQTLEGVEIRGVPNE